MHFSGQPGQDFSRSVEYHGFCCKQGSQATKMLRYPVGNMSAKVLSCLKVLMRWILVMQEPEAWQILKDLEKISDEYDSRCGLADLLP